MLRGQVEIIDCTRSAFAAERLAADALFAFHVPRTIFEVTAFQSLVEALSVRRQTCLPHSLDYSTAAPPISKDGWKCYNYQS